ncbi:hypothetical protein F6X37_01055 [Paraburkholderia sp. 31.1]|nr:hypothetical protein [Paraburkholderia sp. 31.1]
MTPLGRQRGNVRAVPGEPEERKRRRAAREQRKKRRAKRKTAQQRCGGFEP